MLNSTTWLYGAEVLPIALRSKVMGLAAASHFIVNVGSKLEIHSYGKLSVFAIANLFIRKQSPRLDPVLSPISTRTTTTSLWSALHSSWWSLTFTSRKSLIHLSSTCFIGDEEREIKRMQ